MVKVILTLIIPLDNGEKAMSISLVNRTVFLLNVSLMIFIFDLFYGFVFFLGILLFVFLVGWLVGCKYDLSSIAGLLNAEIKISFWFLQAILWSSNNYYNLL